MIIQKQILIGGLFIILVVVLNFAFMGPAIIALNAGLMISWFIWAANSSIYENRFKICLIYSVGILVQGVHFLEEYFMDFHIIFPGFFGYTWSGGRYITFNLIYLFLFSAAAWGAVRNVRPAFLIVWFFTLIAGIGNGIFHPLVSVYQGGYFPGLVSSPLLLIIGILLFRELAPRNQKEV
jgi:hypothetical protein